MRPLNSLGFAVVLLSLTGCFVSEDDAPALPSRTTAVFGTNLNAIADYSPEMISADLFKQSRTFFSGSEAMWEDERELDLDAKDWVRTLEPDQYARTIMLSDDLRYPGGDYTVTHEGTGKLEYRYAAHTDLVEANGSGQETLTLDPDEGGLSITIVESDPVDYLRNFRVLLPGVSARDVKDETPRFNPAFIDSVQSYGVLRFMDWMQTNGSTQRVWADRPVPSDSTWARRGVPVEVMVALANESGKDPWFCMPHLADDSYVERFATYVRDHLDPKRKAYIEYSNEVWNDQFEQATFARSQGQRLRLGSSEFESQLRYYARRSTDVHKIWESVFGSAQRLIRVTASHGSNAWVSSTILAFEDTAAHTDVLAIAPYFGSEYGEPDVQSKVAALTVDQLMTQLRTVSVPEALRGVAGHARVAQAYKVELVAYEGGQHLVGTADAVDNEGINALFDAANRHPAMKQIYADYLKGWRQNGGRLFVHFTSCGVPSKYGRWGALEWMNQPRSAAPKFDAIMDYIDANPRWW